MSVPKGASARVERTWKQAAHVRSSAEILCPQLSQKWEGCSRISEFYTTRNTWRLLPTRTLLPSPSIPLPPFRPPKLAKGVRRQNIQSSRTLALAYIQPLASHHLESTKLRRMVLLVR